eukprot:1053288-Prorocentrum_minimum.AAC.1
MRSGSCWGGPPQSNPRKAQPIIQAIDPTACDRLRRRREAPRGGGKGGGRVIESDSKRLRYIHKCRVLSDGHADARVRHTYTWTVSKLRSSDTIMRSVVRM